VTAGRPVRLDERVAVVAPHDGATPPMTIEGE
jgi:hypothetical protein